MISVVTIVKDDLHGFVRTRQSLQQQTFDKWEHVVVPASEGDSSNLYVVDLSLNRTKMCIQVGRGIFSAMNQGLSEATQEFVVFVNSGDHFPHEDTLARVARQLSAEHNDWSVFGGYVEEIGGRQEVHPLPNPESWWIGCGKANIMHPSVYYRRSFLLQLEGYDETFRVAGDLELNMRARARVIPIVADEPVSVFYTGGISSTRVFLSIYEANKARLRLLPQNLSWKIASWSWLFSQAVKVGAVWALKRSLRGVLAFAGHLAR